MLDELRETDAVGEIAHIYARIRDLTRVPYVSSLQRHLATRPGHLEWAWQVVGEIFERNVAQTTAWEITERIQLPPSANVPQISQLIGTQDEIGAVKNVLNSFIRVSPTNLVFSCILKQRLSDLNGREMHHVRDGAKTIPPLDAASPLPKMLEPLPTILNEADLTDESLGHLQPLSLVIDSTSFVPGLYRMLAHWPEYLAHVSEVLTEDSVQETLAPSIEALPTEIDRQALALDAYCERVPPPVTPGSAAALGLVDVIDRYRKTSPEMVIYSKFLLSEITSSDH